MSTSASNNGRHSVTWADVANYTNEALLSDLQHTTEVLKRAKLNDRCISSASDLEPIYQEQTRSYGSSFHGLDSIEQMLDDYSQKRKSPEDEWYANSLTSQAERPTVQSLFRELEHDSCSRSVGGPLSQSSGIVQQNSFTSDPLQLDSMLGTLQKDMSKHGINTIPKGDCASCGKAIVGQVVIALGKMWHPGHYVCCQCGEELGHRNFFERGGKAYCENDYHDMFSPRCAYCNGPIKDRCVTALGKTFHAEHFVCAECGRQFGEEGFHEKNGQPYCKTDFFRMFAPKCNGCKNPIKMHFITALGTHWHPECFICQECGKAFETGSFYEHGNVPLCEMHYHEKRGSLCATCQKPINGRCVSAVGQKFHPEHFCCSYCRKQLNKGTFKEVDRKPFCHKCYQTTHP
ncbi:LIM domain family protein [Brugia pahangi]